MTKRLGALDARKKTVSPAAIVTLFIVAATLNLILCTAGVWVALEYIAGIDLSFDEALGGGLLLSLARSA